MKLNEPAYNVGQRVSIMGYRSLGSCERVKGTIKRIIIERKVIFYDVLLETGYCDSVEESLIIPEFNPFNARVRGWKAQNLNPVNK